MKKWARRGARAGNAGLWIALGVFGVGAGCQALLDIDGDVEVRAPGSGGAPGTGGMSGGICGDGNVDAPLESCDDGNTMGGDGCSAACLTEGANTCPGNPVVLAPPGVVLQDDTNGGGDEYLPGCGPNSLNELFYAVTPTQSGTLTAMLSMANNDKSLSILSSCGVVDLPQEVSDIVCASGMMDVVQEIWVHAGITYYLAVEAPNGTYTLDLKLNACGDGVKSAMEQCETGDANCTGCLLCAAADEIWDPVGKHCYRYIDTPKTIKNARADCVAWGGDLVGISSKTEFDFLDAWALISADVWTGGHALISGCTHIWMNGEQWRSNWAANQPSDTNHQCVMMLANNNDYFDDRECTESHRFVCERAPAGFCGDGIVQPGEECDDGNAVNLDGCSASCKRDEPCNAIAGSFTDGGHCYWVNTVGDNWFSAKNQCEAKSGYLATISSATEETAVFGKIVANTWIGAYEGGFNNGPLFWESPSTTCGYKPSIIANDSMADCMRLDPNDEKWKDAPCDNNFKFICERDWQ